MNKQQVQGRHGDAKGKRKAVVGNGELEAEGKSEQNAGKAQTSAHRKAKIDKDKKDKKNRSSAG